MGGEVGGIYFNTQSGLAAPGGVLDRLTKSLDEDALQRQQLAGIAPALAATGIPVPAQRGGVLSQLMGGILGDRQSPAAPPAASASQRMASTDAAAAPDTPTAPASMSPNAQRAMAFFQDKGLSPIAAAGLVGGGFANESGGGLDPNSLARGDGGDGSDSVGIANWNGPRAAALHQFAAQNRLNPNDLDTQLQYAWAELNGPERKSLDALQAATNPMQAAVAAIGYERPAGWTAQNPGGAGSFGRRLASTIGLSNLGGGGSAMAYAPQDSGGSSSPGGRAIGAMAGAATGTPPMPIATSDTHIRPTLQDGTSATDAVAGAQATLAGGIPKAALGAMIANPASRQLGLQLWEQTLTGKNYGFTATPGGDIIRTDARSGAAQLVYRAPVKHEVKDFNGRLVDFDPQSSATRDVTPAGMPNGYRPATADERKALGVGPTTPLFFGPDGKPSTLQGGTQVTVNNAVNPILKGLGDQFVQGAEEARSSGDTIRAVQSARTQLQGGIISGAGADQVLGLRKIGLALGIGEPDKVVNTETFRTQIKPIVLSTVKGLGAGSGISNADRDFAEAAVGGKISLDAGTIGRVLDITERAARAKIDRHNALADQMLRTQPDLAAVGPMLRIQPPAAASPAAPQPAQADTSPIGQARAAIAAGAPRDQVLQRLQKMGIDASGQGL